jgi:drug/metabolite transporter (DMT)-like permease
VTRRGLVLFAAMCVLWGVPYFFIRVAVRELTPATLVFARTGLAALVLLPVAVARGGLRSLLPRWLPLLLFAIVEIGVPWLLLASAEERLSSSLTGLLIAAVPLVGALISLGLGNRDGIGGTGVAGLLLGLAGVAAIVGLDVHAMSAAALAEVGAVVVGYAVGPAILARYLADLPAVAVIAVSLALCAVAYAPVAAVQLPHSVPHAGVLASVVVLALACTALAFLLFFALIADTGPVRATVITYVNPAVAAVLGVAALGESFTPGMGVGFVLVLLGSALATRRRSETSESAEPQYS